MEFQDLKYKSQLDPEEALPLLDKAHATCYTMRQVKARLWLCHL